MAFSLSVSLTLSHTHTVFSLSSGCFRFRCTTHSYRGRRDSSAQIIDGTIGTMTVETTSTFFDSSTQTGMISVCMCVFVRDRLFVCVSV